MTRGRIAIIAKNNVYTSTEFNGDMYPRGHGRGAVACLKSVNDVADFHFAVAKFNKNHHHYNNEVIDFSVSLDYLDFTADYFKKWFSDYVYIKNITMAAVEIVVRNGKQFIRPGEIARIYFGELEKIY